MKLQSLTLIIDNEFTGYRAVVRGRNGYPTDATIMRHLRRAKASDCRSWTRIRDQHGNRFDMLNGELRAF